jgi:hypothetical protein
LLPSVTADYVSRPQTSPEAIELRVLNDFADEEAELLVDELLDLIAACPY